MRDQTKGKVYQPIDCNYYDRIEAAIVQKKVCELIYLDKDGEEAFILTRLSDTLTKNKEEFVILYSGEPIRMDRIISLNGHKSPSHRSCG